MMSDTNKNSPNNIPNDFDNTVPEYSLDKSDCGESSLQKKTLIDKSKDTQITKGVTPEKEINGPKGLEPTRYGDWEAKGRCYDF